MSSALRVFRNSVWLVFQPLALNLLSIAVVGYVARVLGQVGYGKLVFALSLVAMAMPLANMGMRALTVREVAVRREDPTDYLAKVLATRFVLSLATVAVVLVFVQIVNYDATTRILVSIASITIITSAVGSTYQDVLQALEKMREVALSQLLGGLAISTLSATVLLLGGNLYAVATVYVVGNSVTMLRAYWYVRLAVGAPGFQWSWLFAKTSIVSAAPFFYPTLVAMAGSKIGVILLSVLGRDAAVGLFGAANGLVERLQIIPDGICTAIYPTLIVLHKESREEAGRLYRKYYEYLLTLGLPIAVGGTLLAKPIILLVYGSSYLDAVPPFRVLTWWLCLSFLTSLQSWTLAAVREERKPALAALITTPIYLLLNLLLIPWGFALGAAWANLGALLVSFGMLTYFVRTRFIKNAMPVGRLMRVLAANAAMGVVVYLVQALNLFVAIGLGALTYVLALPIVGVVSRADFERLRQMVITRTQSSRRAEGV